MTYYICHLSLSEYVFLRVELKEKTPVATLPQLSLLSALTIFQQLYCVTVTSGEIHLFLPI